MKVRTFADLMAGHERAEIYCLYKKGLVRRLKVTGDQVEVIPLTGSPVMAKLSTPIMYEPWFMDRGSLLFEAAPASPHGMAMVAKICTEADVIRFPDGVEDSVMPDLGD